MKYNGQPSVYDLELADIAQDRQLRRERLLGAINGNGTFSEQEYAELVAREVERAQRLHRQMKGAVMQRTT